MKGDTRRPPRTAAVVPFSGSQSAEEQELKMNVLYMSAVEKIGFGVASFRDAAADLYAAQQQGATHREIAKGTGMSVGWVNRMLKWQASGFQGTAFGPESKAQRQKQHVQSAEQDCVPLFAGNATEQTLAGSMSLFGARRAELLDTLELISSCERPRLRSQIAHNLEKQRAAIGLSWAQLIVQGPPPHPHDFDDALGCGGQTSQLLLDNEDR